MSPAVTRPDVVQALAVFAEFTGRAVPAGAADVFAAAFQGTDRTAFLDGVNRWRESHSPSSFLPSVDDLRTAIREAAGERARQQKPPPRSTEVSANPDVARAVFALVRRLTLPFGSAERLSVDEFDAELRRLDREFPGLGFDKAAAEWERQAKADYDESRHARMRRRAQEERVA